MNAPTSDLLQVPGKWEIAFEYSAGRTASKFLAALREKKILATRCSSCERVLIPPRAFCERCFRETTEWKELQQAGEITAWTYVAVAFEGAPPPPYVLAYVRLDGASTSIVNFIRGLEDLTLPEVQERVFIGARVTVTFKERPEGAVTDFWFEPAAR